MKININKLIKLIKLKHIYDFIILILKYFKYSVKKNIILLMLIYSVILFYNEILDK